MKNPYVAIGKDKFWKTGVSDLIAGTGFENLWNPKFEISKSKKIITFGSCFAQHISHWLLNNGYAWQNAEPAPDHLSTEESRASGYGIFSCRTGNIYTVALLKQWLLMAQHSYSQVDEFYFEEGRFFDPLRPLIPTNGYVSKDELFLDRQKTLKSLKHLLDNTEIFIFTMGLTEAWINKNGFIYPACPGTLRGNFNPDEHIFKNYSYDEIMDDMVFIIENLKKLNKNIKFLLTVSPVPLTATASDKHILSATTYSKSVLRAVAGELCSKFADVDYFPSYELITSNATKQNYFETNLRSVKNSGVQFVMNHFGVAIGESDKNIFLVKNSTYSSHEEYCDEIFLESWNPSNNLSGPVDVILIGDSHMGLLSKAFRHLNVSHAGGMVMNGSSWNFNLLHIDEQEIFVPLENRESRNRWQSILEQLNHGDLKKLLIVNFGMQTHNSVSSLLGFMRDNKIQNLTDDIFYDYYLKENTLKIELAKKLLATGHKILVLSDPPVRSVNKFLNQFIALFLYFDEQSLKIFKDLGCDIFNAGVYFSGDKFSEKYYSDVVLSDGLNEAIHGSDAYYVDLAKVIIDNHIN
jgi:hypothetical protein